MKKYLSVTALAARGAVWKLLGLSLLCAALRVGMFWLNLTAELKYRDNPDIYQLMQDSRQSWIFGICFILLYAALCTVGMHYGGAHPGYTLHRLRVSERVTALLWAAVFMAAILIFWAIQAGASLLMCRLYAARVDAAFYDRQTFLVLFYRDGLLHSLLPLDEATRWVRNLCMAAGLGLSISATSFRQRRGKGSYAEAAWCIYAAVIFPWQTGSFIHDAGVSLISLAVAGISLYRIWNGGCYEA